MSNLIQKTQEKISLMNKEGVEGLLFDLIEELLTNEFCTCTYLSHEGKKIIIQNLKLQYINYIELNTKPKYLQTKLFI